MQNLWPEQGQLQVVLKLAALSNSLPSASHTDFPCKSHQQTDSCWFGHYMQQVKQWFQMLIRGFRFFYWM